MAVTTQVSDQITAIDSVPPEAVPVYSWHGRLRVAYFKHTQSGVGDANSTVELVKLPQGSVRVLGALSKIYFSAFGAARTLDLGFAEYQDLDGVDVAADEDFFASAVDVSAAGSAAFDEAGSAARAPVLQSQSGVTVMAKCEAATWPDGAVIEGYVVYVVD
jgi:hypothetical protein